MSRVHTVFDAALSRGGAGPDRREALTLLWAGAAAALAGCGRPREEIVPYVDIPAGLVPGEAQRYATTLNLGGYGRGVLATAIDGRPIRIEGNPAHPASLGATDVFAEASVLDLFDPFRSMSPVGPPGVSSWSAFERALRGQLEAEAADGGKGLALLTGRITSPTSLRQLAALKARFPAMTWARYEPAHDDAERQGTRQAYGRPLSLLPRLKDADVGLWLGADPIGPGPAQIAQARAFAERRRALGPPARWYAAEASMTLSGAAADHRLAASPAQVQSLAAEVARRLGADVAAPALDPQAARFAKAVAQDLEAHPGRALVLAGAGQSPATHALAAWINSRLAATVDVIEPIDPVAEDHASSLAALTGAMAKGQVRTLIVLDANPAYDVPGFRDLIAHVPFSAHIGAYCDETALACRWHAPLSHALESWSDARAFDGTASLIQPLIRPLYDSRSAHDLLTVMDGGLVGDPRDPVRQTWMQQAGGDRDGWWRKTLVAGVIENSAPARQPLPKTAALPKLALAPAHDLVLIVAPHASLWDGRLAPNAWLQDCPEPFTKEVWGASLRVSPADAARLGVKEGDAVFLRFGSEAVEAAAKIAPGQAPGTLGLPLGLGRRDAGPVGSKAGPNAAALRGAGLAHAVPVALEHGGKAKAPLVSQRDTELPGESAALLPTLVHADLAQRKPHADPPSELAKPVQGDHAWGMVIDTDACIGCNACVVACQTENNVPAVGPGDAAMGRDMHWLRIDVYDTGREQAPRPGFEPVPCMQCEQAPCEPVCPVEASVHDHEGLNDQVYNRCVGTRFCQSNCPYKVRRFNFHDYPSGALWDGLDANIVKASRNPEVSVRARGVMEKCTYCVQRISAARRASERDERPIQDGEVVTACQSSCPTQAITFGDRDDAASRVNALKADPRHFTLLQEYGTRPRTTYLARLRNPHPDLEGQA